MKTLDEQKSVYRTLCLEHKEIPLFLQAWWMDAACGDDWNVLMVDDPMGNVEGVLVFHFRKKLGFYAIMPSILTQYGGTWLFYPKDLTVAGKLNFENRVLGKLCAELSALKPDFYEQNFHFSQTNWQPFYWKGYKQTTRYTHIIMDISDMQTVYEGMMRRKRQTMLSKLNDEYRVSYDLSASEFYDLFKSELKLKGSKICYSKELFLRLYDAAAQKEQGRIVAVYDKNNVLNTAVWFVWDSQSAYQMIKYVSPYSRGTSSTFILKATLDYLDGKTKNYDFEGSMIEGVAINYQSFGATLTPFSQISKINNPILRLWRAFKR